MTVVSVYATLFVANIFFDEILQFLSSTNLSRSAEYIDGRDRYQVVRDMREEGKEVYPIAVPGHLIERSPNEWTDNVNKLIPLGGLSDVTTVYCNENGYYTYYKSDRYGFNNPAHVWDERSPDFILIGDSFVHGACVWPHEDIAARFREASYKTLNLGIGGDGPLLELATLREYATKFRPAAILWFYFEGNDLSFLQLEMKFSYLRNYLDSAYTRDLIDKQDQINAIWKEVIREEEVKWSEKTKKEQNDNGVGISSYVKLKNLVRYIKEQLRIINDRKKWGDNKRVENVMVNFEIDSGLSLPVFEKVMQMARQESEKIGAELLFVYLPSYEKYAYSAATYHDEVIGIVNGLGIRVIDFSVYLDNQSDPLEFFPFRKRGHYTPETYSILSDLIIRELDGHAVAERAD